MFAEILIKFARKGIILSPEAYNIIKNSENPINLSSDIILKLKSGNYPKDIVPVDLKTLETIEGISLNIKSANKIMKQAPQDKQKTIEKKQTPQEKTEIKKPKTIEKKQTPQEDIKVKNPAYAIEHVVKIEDTAVSEDAISKYKRNLTESKVNFDKFKVLKDTSNKSYTSGEIGNLIEYFQNRYKKLSGILSKRPELRTWQKINEITDNQTDLNLIVMITEIRTTKNGHYLIEVEDETGSIPILVSKDNDELIRATKNLMKDEVIGIIAQKRQGNELAICQNIIDPGVPRMPRKEVDFATVFTSDIHIGSVTFLEEAFVKFTRWLNGDFGNEQQREMANNVKYMIVGGDIVDGIGVYPNQDKELAIKDITAQYDEAARLLGDIRSDIKIIITPGNHDASRVAEPQPAVPEKYAKSLYQLNNAEFLSNPSIVSLDGLEVLIYHGRGIDDMVMGSNDFSHERNDLVMKEFLNKRHLAPLYGERTPLASELEDHLVIDRVPDVLHTGHVHINTYKNYKGIHCINSGTFQTQTEFQKIYNIVPTPAEVPIIDVGGNYKQLKFID
ncbi:DNA-directed DNA polymerase II small subunit [Methanobrevibacter olleyae]|uniref:DNA polymerase II small subunit n=1 Tax=Methanobrevibacter olleyae TaxID=294671 RepID=A0A126R1K8_METOL|nr:DNA-directed DNA polymerase II small subunit [Methanobrevibacter olleyae]AMK16171.1 DNA polymerase small subunit DP1 PolD1 [Methanobrevibacter olleyae]SFL31529.1 DNA polymerase II small subunit [Methanobrevibacter olleyae]